MKNNFFILTILICCEVVSLLFITKFKDTCASDPCKNKAKCVLDAKNKTLSTCVCPAGYTGKHCELKTGCSTKPCKMGNCIEDKNDRTKVEDKI